MISIFILKLSCLMGSEGIPKALSSSLVEPYGVLKVGCRPHSLVGLTPRSHRSKSGQMQRYRNKPGEAVAGDPHSQGPACPRKVQHFLDAPACEVGMDSDGPCSPDKPRSG